MRFDFSSRSVVVVSALVLASAAMLPVAAQQPQPVRLRGTIAAVEGNVVTGKLRNGTDVKIRLADTARITAVVKGSLADIKPGSFVGITSVPQEDGTQKALEVHIFPESLRGTGEGQRPWDLGPKSLMTNATVDSKVGAVDGPVLTMKYPGGDAKIAIVPDTVIVAFEVSTRDELKPGNKFVATAATKGADDVYSAPSLNVGRDGLTPPM